MNRLDLIKNTIFYVTATAKYFVTKQADYAEMTEEEALAMAAAQDTYIRTVPGEKELVTQSIIAKHVECHPEWSPARQAEYIDQVVDATISAMPFNYDSFAEVASWLDDTIYGEEARQVQEWVKSCYMSQAKILSGAIVFRTLEQVQAHLPAFTVSPATEI
jgi:hypothetical protein